MRTGPARTLAAAGTAVIGVLAAVAAYLKVGGLPGMLYAGIFGFKEAPYYQVPEEAKATPKVDFSGLKRGAGADTTRH